MAKSPPAQRTLSEAEFAALVEELREDPARRCELGDLLKENNPVYEQRGAAAVVRMRGWVLLALERAPLPEGALVFVLEELDNGRDAYLVAAAARALRSAASADPAMADYLVRAITNVREHDSAVSLERYGGYAVGEPGTTAVREILASLRWLGAEARGALPELEAMRGNASGQFPPPVLLELERTIEAIGASGAAAGSDCCGALTGFRWWPRAGKGAGAIRAVMFEDQDGNKISFRDFLCGRPSVVVFFYSRCENPRKCSLTIAKLARVQRILAERGLEDRIRTAAITYDPHYDLPSRLRDYGESRGVRMDGNHRMLRSIEGMEALRAHFRLGVNFIESLVNRHRIEAYVLDGRGEVAGSFERFQWDERELAEQAVRLLKGARPSPEAGAREGGAAAREALGTALPLLAAVLPKCPFCWAAYLSFFGIAGLRWAPYFRWLAPLLLALMAINLGSLWWRGWRRGRLLGFYLAASGAFSIAVLGAWLGVPFAGAAGVALTLGGAVVNSAGGGRRLHLLTNSVMRRTSSSRM